MISLNSFTFTAICVKRSLQLLSIPNLFTPRTSSNGFFAWSFTQCCAGHIALVYPPPPVVPGLVITMKIQTSLLCIAISLLQHSRSQRSRDSRSRRSRDSSSLTSPTFSILNTPSTFQPHFVLAEARLHCVTVYQLWCALNTKNHGRTFVTKTIIAANVIGVLFKPQIYLPRGQ